ncbi:MAG: insulinase family protein [Deltaproteobacteria bacterium]|nr:insulinase family protein [Deltaproteobacteria bacterium]
MNRMAGLWDRGVKNVSYTRFKWAVFVVLFFMLISCKQSLLKPPGELVFEPQKFNFPGVEHVSLENGMAVYLLEDHELPLFNLVALVRTGSIYEPDDKLGLAELTGVVMRTGGTRFMSGDEINEKLEFVAGSVETSIGKEVGTASLSVLKKDMDLGLKIFADVLMYPVFAEDKVDLARKKKEEEIRRRNDNPQSIAFREFKKAVFFKNPRGRISTFKTIAKIKREDMVAFHRNYFHPNNIILGVSGDFKRAEIITRIEELFKGWPSKKITFISVAPPEKLKEESINYAYKDLPQSTIVMGHLAISKTHPDYYPFKVLNFILGGGGFNSRLTSEIRSNRGLAYSSGSFYRAEVDYGLFGAYCFTKSASTVECINVMMEIIDNVKREGISQQELEWAKSSIINNFIFEFTSSAQIVGRRAVIAYDKLPKEFMETYRERIAAVTVDDVNTVAEKYLHLDRAVLMVVGNSDKFDGSLNEFGNVTVIPLEETL